MTADSKIEQLTDLQQKLHPTRFSDISPQMSAYMAFFLGINPVTDPWIISMDVTSDKYISIISQGNIKEGGNFIESWLEMKENLDNIIKAVGNDLNSKEKAEAYTLFYTTINHQFLFMSNPQLEKIALQEMLSSHWK